MSFLRKFLESRTSYKSGDPALIELFGGDQNSAGVSVTAESAMRTTAVFSCVRVISETIGTLPLQMFERKKDGSKDKATGHPLYRLVHRAPNGWQTPVEFRDQVTMNAALQGVGYAHIGTDPRGARSLTPLDPQRMRAELLDGMLVYEYRDGAGRRVFLQDEVLRVPFLVRRGVDPVSPIRLHAETVGQALLSKRYTNNFLRNGGRPPGYVKMDQPFKDKEARTRFKERLQTEIGGHSQGSTLLLEQGDYKAIGISNADAQLLDITTASLLDVCRIYRMPPHMIGELERATWSNVEQMSINFVVYTMGPWLTRWEQALSHDLLTEAEQERYYFEFNVAGLLRGDIAARYTAYAQGRQWGWLSINDIRKLENMNDVEHGDDYLSPSNMVPTDLVGKQPPAGKTANG